VGAANPVLLGFNPKPKACIFGAFKTTRPWTTMRQDWQGRGLAEHQRRSSQ
jgi:hypothetical protein